MRHLPAHRVADVAGEVTPVAKTGLHCGLERIRELAPALARDPGREDRAPLRQEIAWPVGISLAM